MESKKKIAVFTSARSEYGPLKPLIQSLFNHDQFETQLLVGGGHFSHEQGYTYQEIIQDGFEIHTQLPFLINDLNPAGVVRSNGLLTIQCADYFEREKPDLLIVLGDRSELIPIVSAALILSIPIAHLSGGEVTEGSSDNQIRHAVTKMSHLHFPATDIYRQNLLRMGEEDWRICMSGEPGLDEILSMKVPSKEAFLAQFNLPIDRPIIISTFHSETIGQTINKQFLTELVNSLCAETDVHLLFTAANTDVGGIEINETLQEISISNERVSFVPSLGRVNYYAAQHYCSLMLGNSSSGLVEAHSFGIPVINIGSRQDGRLRNANVIDVPVSVSAIMEAYSKANQQAFRESYLNTRNIYGDGQACQRIVDFILATKWEKLLLKRSTF